MQYVDAAWDKAMVKVHQPQKLALCGELGVLINNLHFFLKGSDSLAVDMMA